MELELMVPSVLPTEAEAAKCVLRDCQDQNARLVASAILQLEERLETTQRQISDLKANYLLSPKTHPGPELLLLPDYDG